jgi:putative membrane protein
MTDGPDTPPGHTTAATQSDGTTDPSVELSARRTGMSFQRTRMSADRTLMSVIRTSLSLISFGFTIYQFFEHLQETKIIGGSRAPRNFGVALIYLGVGMVIVGIVFHLQFMLGLRHLREDMKREGLIHGESHFPGSFTLVVAVLLLALGVAALINVKSHSGPFG